MTYFSYISPLSSPIFNSVTLPPTESLKYNIFLNYQKYLMKVIFYLVSLKLVQEIQISGV